MGPGHPDFDRELDEAGTPIDDLTNPDRLDRTKAREPRKERE